MGEHVASKTKSGEISYSSVNFTMGALKDSSSVYSEPVYLREVSHLLFANQSGPNLG